MFLFYFSKCECLASWMLRKLYMYIFTSSFNHVKIHYIHHFLYLPGYFGEFFIVCLNFFIIKLNSVFKILLWWNGKQTLTVRACCRVISNLILSQTRLCKERLNQRKSRAISCDLILARNEVQWMQLLIGFLNSNFKCLISSLID